MGNRGWWSLFCSLDWVGGISLAGWWMVWLHMDGRWLYRTLVSHIFSLSLARELEYPLLSICILLFSIAETHLFFYGHLSAFSLLTF
jgi:hypothetical protein